MIMSTDDLVEITKESPGTILSRLRQKKGYSPEYVAGKLHLRVKTVELLEHDEYDKLPESVFIKGYLRAYAKLLEIPPEPLLEEFNTSCSHEPANRTLWQSKKETHKVEFAVRWLTATFALIVLIAVVIWWHKNKATERFFTSHFAKTEALPAQNESEIRLTDLSKMRSLLTENVGG